MTILIALTITLFLPAFLTIFRNILLSTYLWQIKEYKLSRFQNYIVHNEDPQMIRRLLRPISLILLVLSLIFLVNPSFSYLIFVPALAFIYFTFESLQIVSSFIGRRLIKPKKSIRNLMILLGSLIVTITPIFLMFYLFKDVQFADETKEVGFKELVSGAFDVQRQNEINIIPLSTFILFYFTISSLILDILSPVLVSIFIFLTYPFAYISRYITISRARKKLREFPDLKVIAITGSFGKSTTKEILYELLKNKFKVAKTPKNFNTDIGIAQTILNDLKPGTEIFIAEMGAYRTGEIKRAAKVLRPNISIVTGVNEQHVALFGSIENTFKAKYEIIEALPEDGIAILNGNNEYAVRMAEKSTKKEVMYFTNLKGEVAAGVAIEETKEKSKFPDASRATLIATDIVKVDGKISFSLLQNNNKFTLKVPLEDEHNVSNLLASIAASLEVGITLDEILKILERTTFKLPHLNIKSGINDSLIIDDSYNTNPDGFLIALKKLHQLGREKRVLITQGIIELGIKKGEVYKRISPKILESATVLITNDKTLFEQTDEIKKSSDKYNSFENIYEESEKRILDGVVSRADGETVFLFEGNLPPKIKEQTIL